MCIRENFPNSRICTYGPLAQFNILPIIVGYLTPLRNRFQERAWGSSLPNDASKLVFRVKGFAHEGEYEPCATSDWDLGPCQQNYPRRSTELSNPTKFSPFPLGSHKGNKYYIMIYEPSNLRFWSFSHVSDKLQTWWAGPYSQRLSRSLDNLCECHWPISPYTRHAVEWMGRAQRMIQNIHAKGRRDLSVVHLSWIREIVGTSFPICAIIKRKA